jgi:hypothetical protein
MRAALLPALLLLGVTACSTAVPASNTVISAIPASAVRHVVVFRYKPDATPEKIRQVTEAFAALKNQIPGIIAFEHGVNNSPEKMNQGYTHVYTMTFTNAAARDAYLPHPAHKAFGTLLGSSGIFDGVFVVDYTPAQ